MLTAVGGTGIDLVNFLVLSGFSEMGAWPGWVPAPRTCPLKKPHSQVGPRLLSNSF